MSAQQWIALIILAESIIFFIVAGGAEDVADVLLGAAVAHAAIAGAAIFMGLLAIVAGAWVIG